MNTPLAPTQSTDQDRAAGFHPLVKLAAYAFLIQGVIFVALGVLLPSNAQFFESHSSIEWPEFLTELDEAPTQFLTIKTLLVALRTLYGISVFGVAFAWWSKNRPAAALVLSFIVVSIPVVNTAQLMGMALVPLASDYSAATSLNDTAAMTSIEATARATYTVAEYLDTFVNAVPFVGLLVCLFWLSTKVNGLERIKWILPLLMILPYNKFFDLPSIFHLSASLLNVVATAAYFFLMGWFMLKMEPQHPTQGHPPSKHR